MYLQTEARTRTVQSENKRRFPAREEPCSPQTHALPPEGTAATGTSTSATGTGSLSPGSFLLAEPSAGGNEQGGEDVGVPHQHSSSFG